VDQAGPTGPDREHTHPHPWHRTSGLIHGAEPVAVARSGAPCVSPAPVVRRATGTTAVRSSPYR